MSSSPNKPRILIAVSALELIERESLFAPGFETGGILVGLRLDEERILVVAATEPGPKADRQAVTFAPDTEYVEQQLNLLRRQHLGTNFVGTWHKHPLSFDRPSGGDLKQAREMLLDPAYAVSELVAPIVVVHGHRAYPKVYYISRETTDQSDFVLVSHEPINDQDAENLLRLSREAGVQSLEDRLAEELRLLKASYLVGSLKQLEDHTAVFSVQSGDYTVYLQCPPLFPTRAPTIVLDPVDARSQIVTSTVIAEWTPASHLINIMHEVTPQLRSAAPVEPVSSELVPTRQPLTAPGRTGSRLPASPGLWGLGGALVLALLLGSAVLLVLVRDYLSNGRTEEPPSGATVAETEATLSPHAPTVSPEGDPVQGVQQATPLPISTAMPSATPTQAPTATPTHTPTPTHTATPTVTSTVTTTPETADFEEDYASDPVTQLTVIEPLQVYADGQSGHSSIALSQSACFTLSFAIHNGRAIAYQIHSTGAAVYRGEERLAGLYMEGVTDLVDRLLPPNESAHIEVPGFSGSLCWDDFGVQATDILTLVPSIRYSLGSISCDVSPDQCEWLEFPDAGTVEIKLQQ